MYLQRLFDGTSIASAAPVARTAMRSDSPIAAHDQRLHDTGLQNLLPTSLIQSDDFYMEAGTDFGLPQIGPDQLRDNPGQLIPSLSSVDSHSRQDKSMDRTPALSSQSATNSTLSEPSALTEQDKASVNRENSKEQIQARAKSPEQQLKNHPDRSQKDATNPTQLPTNPSGPIAELPLPAAEPTTIVTTRIIETIEHPQSDPSTIPPDNEVRPRSPSRALPIQIIDPIAQARAKAATEITPPTKPKTAENTEPRIEYVQVPSSSVEAGSPPEPKLQPTETVKIIEKHFEPAPNDKNKDRAFTASSAHAVSKIGTLPTRKRSFSFMGMRRR